MKYIFLLTIVFLLTNNCHKATKDTLVTKLMTSMNFDKDLDIFRKNVFPTLNSQLEQLNCGKIDTDSINTFLKKYQDIFKYNLLSNLSIDNIEYLIDWFDSPLAFKDLSIPNLSELSKQKKEAIDKLVLLMRIEKFNNSFVDQMSIIISKTVLYDKLKSKGMSELAIKEYFNSNDFLNLIANLKSNGTFESHYNINNYYQKFSSLSNDELNRYIKFYSSDYAKAYLDILEKTSNQMFEMLFKLIGQKLKEKILK